MRSGTIKAWAFVDKWTSLVCTVFMLLLCLTGLPLIFHDEIDALTEGDAALPGDGHAGPLQSLDAAVAAAVALYPGEQPLYMSFDADRPVVNVTTGPSVKATRKEMHLTAIDLRTAEVVGPLVEEGFMHVMLRLHVDLFAGLPGELFLGFMGFLLFLSLVPGAVVYAPFMQRLRFGTLRDSRGPRARWLDWHNLLGIATLMWLSVVGLTGVINTLSTPLVMIWRADQLAEITAETGAGLPRHYVGIQAAVETALAAAPGTRPQFVAFPGVRFSSDGDYAVWLHGATPATERLLTPAFVDAETAGLTAMRSMPWYMTVLKLSQPLHFGDYGGLPLKLLWALLDMAAIVILGSGLYLWLARRRQPAARRHADGNPQPALSR